VIGYAVDMLEFPPQFAEAFQVVFGGTLIVESLAQARKLIGRYRMVTTEGELLEKSGAITGGSFRKPIKGFGAAVDDEVARLRSRMEALTEEIAQIEGEVSRGTREIEGRRARRAELDAELSRLAVVTDEIARQREVFQRETSQLMRSLAALEGEVKSGTTELAALEAALDTITDSVMQMQKQIENLKKKLENTQITGSL